VIVGDGACGKVSIAPHIDPGQAQSRAPVCKDGYADGALVLCRNLDLFVDRFLERNFPRGTPLVWSKRILRECIYCAFCEDCTQYLSTGIFI